MRDNLRDAKGEKQMTDRELLELAAKAAGVDYKGWDREWTWNPLTDDGDALRLAVKLRIDVCSDDDFIAAEGPLSYVAAHEPRDVEGYAATRRAIVRAAAATVS